MVQKKKVKVFISYAHVDKPYFEVLKEGIRIHSKPSPTIAWELIDDTMIPTGKDWDKWIMDQMQQCDFAILLVSAHFMGSDYIEKKELKTFLKRRMKDGFLFFPVMLGICDFNQWPELGKLQFFKPSGDKYGRADLKDFTYADLIKFRDTDGLIIPNPHRDRYHLDLVKALEAVMA